MSMFLSIFKKKQQEMEINQDLENVKMIPIPDIRPYMIKGYEENQKNRDKIKELEKELATYKAKAEKNEQLYNAALISTQEFETRFNESNKDAEYYKKLYLEEKDFRIKDNEQHLDMYNQLKETYYFLQGNFNGEVSKAVKLYKTNIEKIIKSSKGNLSKSKILNILDENLF